MKPAQTNPTRHGGPPGEMRAQVVIDARMVGPRPTGIARYVSLLARGLAVLRDAPGGLLYQPVFLTRDGGRGLSTDPLAGFPTRDVRTPFLNLGEIVELPMVIRRVASSAGEGARTIYHSPSFSSFPLCPVPWVTTVHDLIHLQFGSPAQRLYYRTLVRPFIKGAASRTTVSEYSRAEIARWTRLPEASIEVVNTAIDPVFATVPDQAELRATLGRLGLEAHRYFFCLSNPKPHKNVALLMGAYRAYREERSETSGNPLPLVVNIGGFDETPGVMRMPPLSEVELRAVLASAAGFFFPSRSEGFGLPPLEAAVLGSPVAVSRIPPLEEALEPMASGEVHWVDPLDIKGWTDALHRAADGRLPRPSDASRARARDRFAYTRLGENMDRIYREILGL